MGVIEATTNMVSALISIKCLTSATEVAEAYKTIYDAVRKPASNNNTST